MRRWRWRTNFRENIETTENNFSRAKAVDFFLDRRPFRVLSATTNASALQRYAHPAARKTPQQGTVSSDDLPENRHILKRSVLMLRHSWTKTVVVVVVFFTL